MATLSTIREVHTAPKPGLVDRINSGAHADMDFGSFLKSTLALAPGWKRQAHIGLKGTPPEKALTILRQVGLEMEQAMFTVTGGVNTHKGLIFALSFLVYASAFQLSQNAIPSHQKVLITASKALGPCLEKELQTLHHKLPERPLTHGEKLFLEHGVTGIRGEVQKGFPSIRKAGLPALQKCRQMGLNSEDCALEALLSLMEYSEDSNVIHRRGYAYWQDTYRQEIRTVRNQTAPGSDERRVALTEMDRRFSLEGISPGGAADLLSCTLFLENIEKWPKPQNTSWQQAAFPIY